jgi:hypothetical protein
VDRHLGRVGAWDEVGGAEQIEELLVAEPLTPRDQLLAHHGDVGRRPAESRRAEAQEEGADLYEPAARSALSFGPGGHTARSCTIPGVTGNR